MIGNIIHLFALHLCEKHGISPTELAIIEYGEEICQHVTYQEVYYLPLFENQVTHCILCDTVTQYIYDLTYDQFKPFEEAKFRVTVYAKQRIDEHAILSIVNCKSNYAYSSETFKCATYR
jgi:hypothetical protein